MLKIKIKATGQIIEVKDFFLESLLMKRMKK